MKRRISLTERDLNRIVKESVRKVLNERDDRLNMEVTDPIGYHSCDDETYERIMRRGFDAGTYGEGIYFTTKPILTPMYGNNVIKVRVRGTYPAARWLRNDTMMFLVPTEDVDKIEIIG